MDTEIRNRPDSGLWEDKPFWKRAHASMSEMAKNTLGANLQCKSKRKCPIYVD